MDLEERGSLFDSFTSPSFRLLSVRFSVRVCVMISAYRASHGRILDFWIMVDRIFQQDV